MVVGTSPTMTSVVVYSRLARQVSQTEAPRRTVARIWWAMLKASGATMSTVVIPSSTWAMPSPLRR